MKRMSGLAVEIGSRGRHVTFVLLQDAEGVRGWVSLHDRDPIPELGDRVDLFFDHPRAGAGQMRAKDGVEYPFREGGRGIVFVRPRMEG